MMNVSIILIISLTMMIGIVGTINVIPIHLTIITEVDGSLDKSESDVGPENDASIEAADKDVADVIDEINQNKDKHEFEDSGYPHVVKEPRISTPVESIQEEVEEDEGDVEDEEEEVEEDEEDVEEDEEEEVEEDEEN